VRRDKCAGFVIPWDEQQGFDRTKDKHARCQTCGVPYYRHHHSPTLSGPCAKCELLTACVESYGSRETKGMPPCARISRRRRL
jgi:hypothetical protein